ncbi:hypothetical protein SK128_001462, partial [Halocaridina rubra]
MEYIFAVRPQVAAEYKCTKRVRTLQRKFLMELIKKSSVRNTMLHYHKHIMKLIVFNISRNKGQVEV